MQNATPKPTVPTNTGYPQTPQAPQYTQQPQQPAGSAMPTTASEGDVNIEELVSHENPMQLFTDYKKIGEGYLLRSDHFR